MRFLVNLLKGSKSYHLSKDVNIVQSINFETDPIRFQYDAILAEFEALRREIELRIQLTERIIDFFFILLGAILSAAQLSSKTGSFLFEQINKFPVTYLVLAMASTWFAMSHLNHTIYTTTLGRYIELVLSPKLSYIAFELSKDVVSGEQYWKWEAEKFPSKLRGTMRWEAFRVNAYNRKIGFLVSVVGGFRSLLYFAPPILFTTIFFSVKSSQIFWVDWTFAERIILVLFVLLIVILAVGIVTTQKQAWFELNEVKESTAK